MARRSFDITLSHRGFTEGWKRATLTEEFPRGSEIANKIWEVFFFHNFHKHFRSHVREFTLIQPCYVLKPPLFSFSFSLHGFLRFGRFLFHDLSPIVLSFSSYFSAVLRKPIWPKLKVFSSLLPSIGFPSPMRARTHFFPLTYIFTAITSTLSPFRERESGYSRSNRSLLDAASWPEDLVSEY